MPQRNDRSRSTPTTSPKNNSWFRMQAGHQSDADIYIYDEIGFWGVTAKQFISDLNALGDITHINLHINSPGGDVFEGIAIFNALKTHGASITVYVDGVAASMASVIAMVGNPVIMPENTFMMIHKPFGFTGGDAEGMRTYADLLDKVEAVLLPAYAQKTGKTTDEIAAMLADETWMTGGVTVRISIWIIWRPQGCIRCRCHQHNRAMCCCAVLVHRCRIMPPFTVVMASCCTIFLNN